MTHKSNTLRLELTCPVCSKPVTTGVGFRAGASAGATYTIGDSISWDGSRIWPAERPAEGSFCTIGYFECESLSCPTWQDCFPEVQEVVISINRDVIVSAKPVIFKPGQISFDILTPEQARDLVWTPKSS